MASRRRQAPTQKLGRKRRTVHRRYSYKRPLAIKVKEDLSRAGRYEIKLRGEWPKIKSGIRIEGVFLIYEMFDGTTGKVGPEEWRLFRPD